MFFTFELPFGDGRAYKCFNPALKFHAIFILLVRGVKMQMWTRVGSHHLSALLRYNRFPDKPDMTINLPELKTPVNIDDNYGLRLTTYYKVHVFSQEQNSSILDNCTPDMLV